MSATILTPVKAWNEAFQKGIAAGRVLERQEQNDKKNAQVEKPVALNQTFKF
jgi:hypothetical protein